MPSSPAPFSPGPTSERNRVRRAPDRAHYDAATVHAILDAEQIAHVGFVADGQPFVIPTIYGRDGATLYLHGSVASRMMRTLADGVPVSASVTLVDAYVMARSAFHHSMNYRSVVVFGVATACVDDDEKLHGLRVVTEHLAPGRWDEVRAPSRSEIRQTAVLRLPIEEASAKARTHGVADEEADLGLPVWAGLIPVVRTLGEPVPDPALDDGIVLAPSIATMLAR